MLENSHCFDVEVPKEKHVSAASKENDDLADQLLQNHDDMLNESDIAIKQGSHKKLVPKFCAIVVSSYYQI